MPFIGIQQREKKKLQPIFSEKNPNKYHLYSLLRILRCSHKRSPMAAPPFILHSPPPLPLRLHSFPSAFQESRQSVRSERRFSCRSTAAFDSTDAKEEEEKKPEINETWHVGILERSADAKIMWKKKSGIKSGRSFWLGETFVFLQPSSFRLDPESRRKCWTGVWLLLICIISCSFYNHSRVGEQFQASLPRSLVLSSQAHFMFWTSRKKKKKKRKK